MYQSGRICLWLSLITVACGAACMLRKMTGLGAAVVSVGLLGVLVSYLLRLYFGRSIRRVRVREVANTYIAYVVYQQNRQSRNAGDSVFNQTHVVGAAQLERTEGLRISRPC